MRLPKGTPFYLGVFVISGAIMALQIIQTRLLSIVSWYHLSFAIISLTMLGLTAGALRVFKWEVGEVEAESQKRIQYHCMWFGIYMGMSTVCLLLVPFKFTFFGLLGVAIATALIFRSYFHAGVVITIALMRSGYPISIVYGVDLVGASFGCLFALGLLSSVDTTSALIFLTSVTLLSTRLFGTISRGKVIRLPLPSVKSFESVHNISIIGGLICLCFALLNSIPSMNILYPVFIKGKIALSSQFDVIKSNSISRVTVQKELEDVPPFLWGASPVMPKSLLSSFKLLQIDGDAGTPITRFKGDIEKHSYLEFDVTNIVYAAPEVQSAAIIGVGGGRDVLSAKYFGVPDIVALDVNPVQIELLTRNEKIREYAGIDSLPGVTYVAAEARSWFRQNRKPFDVIQMSLIDTWAATGSGAFALSENGLYTAEAWEMFIQNLTPHGMLTVSRWATAEMFEDIERTFSTALQALDSLGVAEPSEHLAYFQIGRIGTVLISRSPFTDAQRIALLGWAKAKQFNVVVFPGLPLPKTVLGDIIAAKSPNERAKIYSNSRLDISPATDMRPFFFNQARLTSPYSTFENSFSTSHRFHFSRGQAKASASLLIIMFVSLFAVACVLVYPNLTAMPIHNPGLFLSGTAYFLLIGLGFMLVEISLMQALGMFLGHPMFGFSIVLFSLILSSGIGSLLSERIKLDTMWRQIFWVCLLGSYLLLLGSNLQSLLAFFGGYSLFMRAITSVGIAFPAGLLMGFAFPTGISLVSQIDRRTSPWFWAINGAAGVLAASLALACNITFGIDVTIILGAVSYILLIAAFLGLSATKKRGF